MKGKKCIKLVILSIIYLLSLNQFSNADAITFTQNLNYIGSQTTGGFKCVYQFSNESSTHTNCNIPAISGADAASVTRKVLYLETNNNVEFKKGHIYEVQIDTRQTQSTTGIDYPIPVIWTISSSGTPVWLRLRNIDINYENRGFTNSITQFNNTPLVINTYPQEIVSYSIFLEAAADATAPLLIGRPGAGEVFNLPPTSSDSLYVPAFQIAHIGRVNEYSQETATDEAAEKELEDRDNLETQQGETDNGAEDSSQDFGAATTNISGVINTFISNLNNLNANNCTLPEIAAYGFSIGKINLCTYSPPNWVQGVTTAIISLITLRLAWHLFRRIMGIAKGLAGSK